MAAGMRESSRPQARRESASFRLFALRPDDYRATPSGSARRAPAVDACRFESPLNLSRRRLIFTGAAGAAVLVAARWLAPSRSQDTPLAADAADVMRAIVPALLDGALPDDLAARKVAVDRTVSAVGTAVAGLPPNAREELATLFALLALAPIRVAFANIGTAWRDADVAATNAFLVRLQKSRWAVKRTAYDALHQLTFAAWYADPQAWTAVGYPGPPVLR